MAARPRFPTEIYFRVGILKDVVFSFFPCRLILDLADPVSRKKEKQRMEQENRTRNLDAEIVKMKGEAQRVGNYS